MVEEWFRFCVYVVALPSPPYTSRVSLAYRFPLGPLVSFSLPETSRYVSRLQQICPSGEWVLLGKALRVIFED